MENNVESFFKWRNTKGKSIEEMHADFARTMIWERTDVLYSFIGIYQIGLYAFYPEQFERTNSTIRVAETHKFFGNEYLIEEEGGFPRFMRFEELNEAIEESGFVELYDSVGNIIPVWPGANYDRGMRSYCFDIPDIYFGYLHPEWFQALKSVCPNGELDAIMNETYSIATKDFLDLMTKEGYVDFLKHAVGVMKARKEAFAMEEDE